MSQILAQAAGLTPAFSSLSIPAGARICAINIMDNAEGTKRHFEKTLLAADPNAKITWCRMQCAKEDPKYFREQSHLLSEEYTDWQDVIGIEDFDLAIFTGINRGNLSYEDLAKRFPAFWNESKDAICAIEQSIKSGKTGHGAFVCWSAFAYMKELYGVEKGIHPEKFYGLFPHKIVTPPHPLVTGFAEDDIHVPQSRYSYMEESDLNEVINNHEGQVVMNGPDGPAIWTLRDDRITCFINHLEYSAETLQKEYEFGRSQNNGVFNPPQNYKYDPNGQNTDLEITFDSLRTSCAKFYKNLIELAVTQKSASSRPAPEQTVEVGGHQLVFGT